LILDLKMPGLGGQSSGMSGAIFQNEIVIKASGLEESRCGG
jgi:hypothetical protein